MNLKIKLDVQVYPDGEIIVFDEGGEIIGKLTANKVIKSIAENLRVCDWLTDKDLYKFIKKLERIKN